MTYMTFDIEADGFLEDATKIHCISIAIDFDEPKCYVDSVSALRILAEADVLVGHNIIGYDLPLLRKLAQWSPKNKQKILDTFTMSKIVWPDIGKKDEILGIPKKYWGRYSLRSFGYRLKMNKGDMDDYMTMTEDMAAYCKQDVRITSALFKIIKARGSGDDSSWGDAVTLEMDFAAVAQEMEEEGIYFDTSAALDLQTRLDRDREEGMNAVRDLVPPVRVEMKTPQYWEDPLTGCKWTRKSDAHPSIRKELVRGPNKFTLTPFNPMSRPQVAAFLMSRGWKPVNKTPTGKPRVDEGTLLSIEGIPEAATLASLYRVQKMIGMVAEGREAWLKLAKGDRIHPHLNTIGAVSGRTSCVRPNLQQVPSSRLQYGADCRKLFGAPPGYDMVSCDAKSLEVRCFAHYMAKYDEGEFAREVIQGDVHQLNADMLKCDRQTAKNTFFALIYGASPKKIASMLDTDEEYAKDIVDRLFAKRPAMGHVISGIKRLASTRGWLLGLDGRRLYPRSEHSSVNLLVQAAGAVVSKKATVNLHEDIVRKRLNRRGVSIVGFIHDEILMESPKDISSVLLNMAISAFQDTTNQYNLRCAMDGDGSIGDNWYEVH